ncbi:hypothetical protein VTO73DRAFT_4857 [Trametes versicolor]
MADLNIPVLRHIFAVEEMETIVTTCRPASFVNLVVADEEVQERIDALFAWFALDVDAFKAVMRETRAFLGGSLPLTMFSPVRFTPSNADIFVPDTNVVMVQEHLIRQQVFSLDTTTTMNPVVHLPNNCSADEDVTAYGAGLLEVRSLRRGGINVNLLSFPDRGTTTLNTEVLNFTWTTLLMNYVTADYACCAYPSMTFMGRGLFHMGRWMDRSFPGDNSHHLLNTYGERGFEFTRHPSGWFDRPDQRCSGNQYRSLMFSATVLHTLLRTITDQIRIHAKQRGSEACSDAHVAITFIALVLLRSFSDPRYLHSPAANYLRATLSGYV